MRTLPLAIGLFVMACEPVNPVLPKSAVSSSGDAGPVSAGGGQAAGGSVGGGVAGTVGGGGAESPTGGGATGGGVGSMGGLNFSRDGDGRFVGDPSTAAGYGFAYVSAAMTTDLPPPDGVTTKICGTGTVPLSPNYSAVAGIGWNVNQAPGGAMPAALPGVVSALTVAYANPAGSELRLQVSNGTSYWCSVLPAGSGTVTLTASQFNSACWNGSGTAWNGQGLVSVQLIVPSKADRPVSFDACLEGVRLSFGNGGQGGGSAGQGGGSASGGSGGAGQGQRVDNPYDNARPYVNSDWANLVRQEANNMTNSASLRAGLSTVAAQPTFVWFDRIASLSGSTSAKGLAQHLDAALQQQTNSNQQVVFQMVVYNLPNRDCAALASNGELQIGNNGMQRYRSDFIDPLVATLSNARYAGLRIVAVLEVDSLPNLITNASSTRCQQAAGPGGYVEGITYALNRLATVPNVYTYIDIAHSGWMGWDNNRTRFAEQLSTVIQGTTRGWGSVAGFASNTSNYTPVQELLLPNPDQQVGGQPIKSASFYQYNAHFGELSYVTALRNELIARGAPNRIGMLIDTGRNGWGGPGRPMAANGSSINQYVDSARIDRRLHRGNWCNQASAGIGERPRANPHPGVHAYVWVKPPGESDGISTMLTVPHPDGKQHDPMCSPTYRGSQDANGGNLTGAMGSAPHAGEWFPAHVRALAGNAHPAL